MVCKGVCTKYKAVKVYGGNRYEIGQKRCSECGMFLYWDGKLCPCCNFVLNQTQGNQNMSEIAVTPTDKENLEFYCLI